MYAKYEDSPEQIHILRQLKDMFASTPHWRLREVCRANKWNLDSCVDHLMESEGSTSQERKQQNSCNNDNVKSSFSKDEERVGSLLKKGYRVMILMRGPPGAGKSYLARSLLNKFLDLENDNYKLEDFICSSDDYFYNKKGEYKYNSVFISNAHDFNHQKVKEKAQSGLSPIIVDNTNMKLWEMLPYVKLAVQNNYLIEILEPKNSWCNSSSALAQKNRHGVTKNRIQYIMEKYERGNVASLTKMLKNTKYTLTLPQMRLLPPINTSSAASSFQNLESNIQNIPNNEEFGKQQTVVLNLDSTNNSKEPCFNLKPKKTPAIEHHDYPASSMRDVYSLLENKTTNAWKTFESESANFWNLESSAQQPDVCNRETNFSSKKSLLDLLREDSGNAQSELKTLNHDDNNGKIVFQRHSINCPNENVAFLTLRQIYPNKRVSGLWDLFIKCNGHIDWAVDILLKEDELQRLRDASDTINQSEDEELFECLCNNLNSESKANQFKTNTVDDADNNKSSEENIKTLLDFGSVKPQRQRSRVSRCNQLKDPALLEVKENIENCFVLGNDLYSQKLLKIRNIRSGIKNVSPSNTLENNENLEHGFLKNKIVETVKNDSRDDEAEEDNESDDFGEEMLEISLGEHLVQQLVDTFRNESSVEEQVSSSLPQNLNVFMPRSLAKQIYMLWIESVFNHLEDERLKLIREDEDFARLLHNPKYSEFKQSPGNVQEILDMEYAWNIYSIDKKEHQQKAIDIEQMHVPTDLATHLTQMKLCETFPDIPRETLLDILVTNGNDYKKTIAVLESTMQTDDFSTTQDLLMECARREQVLVNQEVQNQMEQRQERINNNWDEYEPKNTLSPDEAKRLALLEFEETRNSAAHHCQLKAECYQKAKEAIQRGNGGAAIYYSQIANLHIKKIDMYNHRAANCIIEVHKNTQNNPDLLDLHYLYLIEALGCLDLFLDRHITGLRSASRNYKHVFIITGRGKHSAGGVSTIKNKVKARLKERCLRWSEVNPGLLKVKIFSGSRHSKNI